MENDHHDHRAIVTNDLVAAGAQAGVSLPKAVANIVLSLSHYDPDWVKPDGTAKEVLVLNGTPQRQFAIDVIDNLDAEIAAKEHDPMDVLDQLIADAEVMKGINTVDDFLSAVWVDPLTKEEAPAEHAVLKARDEDHFLLMVAYSPNRMPLRGADKMIDLGGDDEVMEKGCWRFMAKGAKTGMFHQEGHGDEAVCVENGIYRNDEPWVVKDTKGEPTGEIVRKGDWLVGFILSDYAWGLYKSGQIGGVSMQGGARRKPASAAALARVRSDA